MLARTPRVLRVLLHGTHDSWVHARSTPEGWWAFDVVGHFIHGEKTDWLPRVRMILEHGETQAFEPFDRHAQERDSAGRTMADLLEEFERRRAENVATLRAMDLSDEDLDRRGRHPELGVVTLRQLLATWVAHDLHHLSRVARAMARRHGDDVGPWRVYLGVLTEGL